MKVLKNNNAVVRIHGTPDNENFKKATEKFLKKVIICRKKKKREEKSKIAS